MSDDDDIFTLDGMISVLLQGCTVVCKPNQAVYDHIIVFLLDPLKGITQSNIGIIGDQSKNKAVTGPLLINPETVTSNIPIISIVNQHGHRDSEPAEENKYPTQGSTGHHAASSPHYQLYLRDSPLIPATIRQSFLEFDTPLTSYKTALTEEGLSFDNLDQRMARLRSNRDFGSSSCVRPLQ